MAQHTHTESICIHWEMLFFQTKNTNLYSLSYMVTEISVKSLAEHQANRTETSVAVHNKEYRLYKIKSEKRTKDTTTTSSNNKP